MILLGAGILLNVIGAVSTINEIKLLSRIVAEAQPTWVMTDANDIRHDTVRLFQLLTYYATVVFFLRWIHRAHRNLPSLGALELKFSPGWAVGWWFIPLANLVRPYQAVKEICKASDPCYGPRDGVAWKETPSTQLLGWWWALWIMSNCVGILGLPITLRSGTPYELLNASWVFLLNDILSVITGVLLLLLVKAIDARQEERARRLTLLDKGTSESRVSAG